MLRRAARGLARSGAPSGVLLEGVGVAMSTDDAALDALAAALAPRLLEKVRELIAREQDDDHELGLAVMRRLGYEPACPKASLSASEPSSDDASSSLARRSRRSSKRS